MKFEFIGYCTKFGFGHYTTKVKNVVIIYYTTNICIKQSDMGGTYYYTNFLKELDE